MRLDPLELERIRDLYRRGLCLQAYEAARPLGPFQDWEGADARILAGRLALNLGARRLGRSLHLRAWRTDPGHVEAFYYYANTIRDLRGPLEAWRLLRPFRVPPGTAAADHADLLALKAVVLSGLRDFDAAERWLDEADRLSPGRPWLRVERALVLEAMDRREEALAVVREALEARPWFRPAVQLAASLMVHLGRDPEALELLSEAEKHVENGHLIVQRALLETELGRYEEARQSLDRVEKLMPLAEKDFSQWLRARRSDAALYCGDLEAAARLARSVDSPFYKEFSRRFERGAPPGRRVLLPVGFVRQHHMTCSPATLAAIGRYWSMPVDHLHLAEEICYDGTPASSERRWAEENGWTAREFTVTWESGMALLDRGVPFTLTTVEPTSAHLQAVIGYDSRLGTFIVRDPGGRHFLEYPASDLLERYRATGPRGMILLPKGKESLIEGIDLPDASHYDLFNRVELALRNYDRAGAWQACLLLQQNAPGHRLALRARRAVAAYDQDHPAELDSLRRLLELYPSDGGLHLAKLNCLLALGRRQERREELCRLAEKEDSDPVFQQAYAAELGQDGRHYEEAVRRLRKAIRLSLEAESLRVLANVYWDRRQFEEALELYRFAACLGDKDEGLAMAYFLASWILRRSEEAVGWLRRRIERYGSKSGGPARTLFQALERMDRLKEAFDSLEEAAGRRPEDGVLLLFMADMEGRYGREERAQELLRRAEGHSPASLWLRTAALLASYRGERAESLRLWKRILETEPLNVEAHVEAARLLAETEGPQAALAHLQGAVERFPFHCGLQEIKIQWLRDRPEEAEPVLRRLIELHPENAWARRERALHLARLRRIEEAFEEANTALRIEPAHTSTYAVRARLYEAAGKRAMAQASCRQAIRLAADNEGAISHLLSLSDTPEERREALEFIHRELLRQQNVGDGLHRYWRLARETLVPREVLQRLVEIQTARPDLWQTWSCVIGQLSEMDLREEAREKARMAMERFPLVPRLWIDSALAARLRGDGPAEIEALRQALRINPAWTYAAQELAEAYERAGRFPEARATLEQASARAPMDASTHGALAQVLWKTGERESAVERIRRAIQLDPDYPWAWHTLRYWSRELGRPGLPVETARELATRRGGESRSWLILAGVLDTPKDFSERLAALDRALQLDPRLVEAHEIRAITLAAMRRLGEAEAACRPAVFGDRPPLELEGRAACLRALQGDLPGAIRAMSELTARNPTYFWGWARLAEWRRDEGSVKEYLEAADQLVSLNPQSVEALEFRADARVRNGDRDGAKRDLRRALEIQPDSAAAGERLCDLCLEDDQTEEAAAVLARLKLHVRDAFVLNREINLALRHGERSEALDRMAEMCLSATEDPWPLAEALDRLGRAGLGERAEKILLEALNRPGVNPLVPRVLAERYAADRRWGRLRRLLKRLGERPPLWMSAARAALAGMADAGRGLSVRWFVRRNRRALRADPEGWVAAGSALFNVGAWRAAAGWLGDWKDRPDVEPGALLTLSLALRYTGREAEAKEIVLSALKKPADSSLPLLEIWSVLDGAFEGRFDDAGRAGLVGLDDLTPYYRFLRMLILALEQVRTASALSPSGRKEAFRKAREKLGSAVALNSFLGRDPLLRRLYWRAVGVVGRARGGFAGWIWALVRRAAT